MSGRESSTYFYFPWFVLSRQELAIIHWGKTNLKIRPRLLSPSAFFESVREGYQATAHQQQGRIYDPVTGEICQWDYCVETRYTWGDNKRLPKQQQEYYLIYRFLTQVGRF